MINLKFKKEIFYVFIIASMIGCIIPSFQPIYNDNDLLFDNELVGSWVGARSIWTFEKGMDQSYNLTYKECDDPINNPSNYSSCTMAEFRVHLIKLDNDYYVDFLPINYTNTENLFLLFHVKALHSFAKITFNKENLDISFLDYIWTKNLLKEKPDLINHTVTSDGVILTASTSEIQQFLKINSSNKEAYTDPLSLQRSNRKEL